MYPAREEGLGPPIPPLRMPDIPRFPIPGPLYRRSLVCTRYAKEALGRTSPCYEHAHVLRSTRDSRANSEGEDERKQDGFATESGYEVSHKRNHGSRCDGVRTSRPDEVCAVEMVDNSRKGRRYRHLHSQISGQRGVEDGRMRYLPDRAPTANRSRGLTR